MIICKNSCLMWSDIKIIFVILKSIELITFILYGFILSRTKSVKEYWHKAWMPILIFTLVEGLRFGRRIDYNVYFFRYENIGNNFNSEDYEFLFKTIVYIFYNCDIPYCFFIATNSLFIIFSIFLLLQHFRKYLKFVLPILLFCTIQSENYIRWYLAFAFVLIALHYLIQEKKKYSYIFFICAIFVHVGTLFLFPIFFFTTLICKLRINPYVASILCIIMTLGMSIADMGGIVATSNFLLSIGIGNIDDRIASYLLQTENLINGEFGRAGYYATRSVSNNVRFLLANIPLIVFAKQYMRKEKYGMLIYNLFIIGVIVFPVFSTVEILDRFASALTFFSCVVCGVTLYNGFKDSGNSNKWVRILLFLCLFANFWPNVSNIIFRTTDNDMLFIWDANGRDFLPYWQWLDQKIL